MPARKRSFTQKDLFDRSISSGVSVVLVRFLVDQATASLLGEDIYADARDHIRGFEIESELLPGAGFALRFHLVDHIEPPPCYEVVEEAARRHLRLEHIVPGLQR